MVQGKADGSTLPGPQGPSWPGRLGAVEAVPEGPRSQPTGFDGPGGLRRAQWEAQRAVWWVSQDKRQGWCRRVPRGEFVLIEKRANVASFGQLFHCGKNSCPLCGPKIAVERAADIGLALAAHHLDGGTVGFPTFTMRHTRAQRLTDLLAGLLKASRAVTDDKTVKAMRFEWLRGRIVRTEVTVGPNGWHPHRHEFVFYLPGVTEGEARQLAEAEWRAWSGSLIRQGLGKPSRQKGYAWELLTLGKAHEKVADYLAKSAAHELASASTKWGKGENRTPNQLLRSIAQHGQAEDVALWREYEQAFRGKRVLRWSPGLRDALLADVEELTDQQAADSTDGLGRLIAAVNRATWSKVTKSAPGPAALLEWAEVFTDDTEAAALIAARLAEHDMGELEAGSM